MIDPTECKKCNKCGEAKAITTFAIDNNLKSGRRGTCSSCIKEYRTKNKDIISQYHKKRYLLIKDEVSVASKSYYEKNKEEVRSRHKKYRENNKESINEYYRRKRLNDPMYRVICSMRTRVNRFCRQVGINKANRTIDLIGCSIEEFKFHIEFRFVGDMSWDNYGKWHIDHITPLSTASNSKDLMTLNHYTNLQPLWAFDNISKGNRVL